MTPEQYAALQAVITAKATGYVSGFSRLFLPGFLTVRDWLGLLELLWPAVKQARTESSELARTFYDQQRDLYHPTATNLARQLEPYEFEWFVQDMEPVRKVMSVDQPPPAALEMVQLQVARSVENGGRRQIIHAIEADDLLDEVVEPTVTVTSAKNTTSEYLTASSVDEIFDRIYAQYPEPEGKPTFKGGTAIRGWARVATGRETCAWCLMLVARGPVYKSARTAGLRLGDDSAIEAIENDADVTASLNEWHPGCDCKVVPVFNSRAWVGSEASLRALNFWIDAGKKADIELENNPDKKYYSVKERRWKKTTNNRETINQLRQMIDSGAIKSSDWAALAAA